MTAVSVTAIASVAAGIGIGVLIGRRRGEGTARRPGHGAGMTVSQMLQRTVSLAPVGVVVVDTLRDVVVANDRAVELGLVRERLLDDRVWAAAQRTLATGEDVEVDLSAPRGVGTGRHGLSVRGHVRLLSDDHPRFAVVYLDDQSEQTRMEASRRDFIYVISGDTR